MKAITLTEPGTQPALCADKPTPTPGTHELLIRVHASSVNPVDNAIPAVILNDMTPTARNPADAVISALGPALKRSATDTPANDLPLRRSA